MSSSKSVTFLLFQSVSPNINISHVQKKFTEFIKLTKNVAVLSNIIKFSCQIDKANYQAD